MTRTELENRVSALEDEVRRLRADLTRLGAAPDGNPPWWAALSGQFAGSAAFQEAARLGLAYRESLRPGRRKEAAAQRKKAPHARP